MPKTPPGHDQEQFLPVPLVSRLNATRGVVLLDMLQDFEVEPGHVTTIADYAGQIGVGLSRFPRQSRRTDQSLEVYGDDFDLTTPQVLASSLYFPNAHRGEARAQVITAASESPDISGPGVQPQTTGVVFEEYDFKLFPRFPGGLRTVVHAQTRGANKESPDLEDTRAKAGRSVLHTMDQKKRVLTSLDDEYAMYQGVLRRVYCDARQMRDPKTGLRLVRYTAKELEGERKLAEELIHETVRLACINLDYGTTKVNAMQRSVASRLHRAKTSPERATEWANYTTLAGQHQVAKRAKITQARKACDRQVALYARFMQEAA